MDVHSTILREEKLSKVIEKEKEALISDFSALILKCSTYPFETDEEWTELIRMADSFCEAHKYEFATKLAVCLLDECNRQHKKRHSK